MTSPACSTPTGVKCGGGSGPGPRNKCYDPSDTCCLVQAARMRYCFQSVTPRSALGGATAAQETPWKVLMLLPARAPPRSAATAPPEPVRPAQWSTQSRPRSKPSLPRQTALPQRSLTSIVAEAHVDQVKSSCSSRLCIPKKVDARLQGHGPSSALDHATVFHRHSSASLLRRAQRGPR